MQLDPLTTGPAPHADAVAFPAGNTALSQPVPSSVLFNGTKAVLIEHNGSLYRLQSTKLGKLILTK